jgi:hypothetical protein
MMEDLKIVYGFYHVWICEMTSCTIAKVSFMATHKMLYGVYMYARADL